MPPQTHNRSARRVLVVADRDLAALDDAHSQQLTEAVRGSHVLVVAPAGPAPGERWIVDLTVRAAHAQRRLDEWVPALAPHALAVGSEIGDANPRLALSDAQHAFGPDTVVAPTLAANPASQLQRSPRLRPRQQHATTSGALPIAA